MSENLKNQLPHFAVLQLTRALDAASGDVSYTGFGFRPKAVILLYGAVGLGFQIGHSAFDTAVVDRTNVLTNGGTGSSPALIVDLIEDNGAKEQRAVLKSIDADGFSLTWTRVGVTAAGTAYITALGMG